MIRQPLAFGTDHLIGCFVITKAIHAIVRIAADGRARRRIRAARHDAVEVDPALGHGRHRRMIRVAAVGQRLRGIAPQARLDAFHRRRQLRCVLRIVDGFDVDDEAVFFVGGQLHVVRRRYAAVAGAHEARFRVAHRSLLRLALVGLLARLQPLDLGQRLLQSPLAFFGRAQPRRLLPLRRLLLGLLAFEFLDVAPRRRQVRLHRVFAPETLARGVGADLGAVGGHPLQRDQPILGQHRQHFDEQLAQGRAVSHAKSDSV